MSDDNEVQQLQALDSFSFRAKIWYANYKGFLFLLIPLFLLSLFIIFKFSLYDSKAERDFLSAKNAYLQWEKSKESDNNHFQILRGFIKKHPELAVPYESLIIQKLLTLGKEAKTTSFIESFLKRQSTKPETYYTQFAHATLMIEKGDIVKALEKSLSLKEAMLADKNFWESQKTPHFGSVLFAFNLLRVAMLSKNLQKNEEELVAWRELKRYAKWDQDNDKSITNLDNDAFDVLLSHFTHQDISLKDYIKHRESRLLLAQN